jgi:hypothetical protein
MEKLDSSQLSAISRLFSSSVIGEMARKGRSPVFARLARESLLLGSFAPSALVLDLFEAAFSILKRRAHRDEYVYKAALTHKILLGVHSLHTASMLTEFRIGECKADVVILNGTASVYEIKSERDSLCRLDRQVRAYRQVFARVNVIAGEHHVDAILETVPKDVGIMKLSDRYQISPVRESLDQPERTKPAAIFDSVRLSEAKHILEDNDFTIPRVPNTQLYSTLRSRFIELDPRSAHIGMVKALKKSRNLMPLADLVGQLPSSLQSAALSIRLRKNDHGRLVGAVNTRLSEALTWA